MRVWERGVGETLACGTGRVRGGRRPARTGAGPAPTVDRPPARRAGSRSQLGRRRLASCWPARASRWPRRRATGDLGSRGRRRPAWPAREPDRADLPGEDHPGRRHLPARHRGRDRAPPRRAGPAGRHRRRRRGGPGRPAPRRPRPGDLRRQGQGRGAAGPVARRSTPTPSSSTTSSRRPSPATWRRSSGRTAIDRTAVILDIFAQNARTQEGKAQVELAQLRYRLPRLRGRGMALSQQAGGIGTRGPGETQLEVDRRRLVRRMTKLEAELKELTKNRRTQRRARARSRLSTVSLVGYTNAGKSTLLNRLTDAGVLVEDRLFATLDPRTRRLQLPGGETVLLTDTVGFVRKLPHQLVEAFRSTLEVVKESDLLVHVVDASADDPEAQIDAVRTVLAEIGADQVPELLAFNKADVVPGGQAAGRALSRVGRAVGPDRRGRRRPAPGRRRPPAGPGPRRRAGRALRPGRRAGRRPPRGRGAGGDPRGRRRPGCGSGSTRPARPASGVRGAVSGGVTPAGFAPPSIPTTGSTSAREKAVGAGPGGVVDLSIGTPSDPPAGGRARGPGRGRRARGGARATRPSVGSLALPPGGRRRGWRHGSASTCPSTRWPPASAPRSSSPPLPQWLRLRTPERDTVLYPAVSYPTYEMGAVLAGCRAVPVPVDAGLPPRPRRGRPRPTPTGPWPCGSTRPATRPAARRPGRGGGVGAPAGRAGVQRRVLRRVHLGRPAPHHPRARARPAWWPSTRCPSGRTWPACGSASTPATPSWSTTCARCASTSA